jgi:urease accessory protein
MHPLAALMVLADGRLPVGGHAHSGGIEAAIRDGRVATLDDVESFVVGRVHTVGLMEAAFAAATVLRLHRPRADVPTVLRLIDAEADARVPSAPLRAASRRLGRQLTRVASDCWPDPLLVVLAETHEDGAHQPVALGTVAVAAGLDERQAAALALHHAISTPIQAAVKIAGFDPFALAAMTVRLAPAIDVLTTSACSAAAGPLAALPSATAPLLEIASIRHDATADRLFAT